MKNILLIILLVHLNLGYSQEFESMEIQYSQSQKSTQKGQFYRIKLDTILVDSKPSLNKIESLSGYLKD